MKDAQTIKRELERPFPTNKVHWRIGATNGDKTRGTALAYVDSRDVMKRLDDVLGPENWQRRYSHVVNGLVVCEVGIRFGDDWIWKADGAGQTDYEGDKGSMSDSFKRAAVNFGIARYLYALPAPWVAIKPQGKSYTLDETPQLPKWAIPEGYDEIMAKKDQREAE